MQVSLQLRKSTLSMFQHLGRACIYFLLLHIPYVLWYNGDPTVEDFMGTWAGILPLAFPSHIYIYIWLEDFDCFTFCIFKSQELVRRAILSFCKLSLVFCSSLLLLFSFLFRTFFSLAPLISARLPTTFNSFSYG